jgi:hypothetical protein
MVARRIEAIVQGGDRLMELGLYSFVGIVTFLFLSSHLLEKQRETALQEIEKVLQSEPTSLHGHYFAIERELEGRFSWQLMVLGMGLFAVLCVAVWPVVLIAAYFVRRASKKKPRRHWSEWD